MKLKPKVTVFLCLGLLLLGIGGTAGFYSWRSYVIGAQEKRSYESAKHLLAQSRPLEALKVIKTMKSTSPDYDTRKWMPLEIQALEESRNVQRLLYLYGQHPLEILKQEKASALLARTLLEMKKMDTYAQVRGAWQNGGKKPEVWFALDVDALLMQGKPDKALALLTSRSFTGAADCGRLIRLALLQAEKNLDEAWRLLEEAYHEDPHNADVRSFRAQILEQRGLTAQARVEYVAAHICDPENPLLRDQLAEFYRRNGDYAMALKTWIDGMSPSSMDFFWIKALFWSKVAHPIEIPPDKAKPPAGDWTPLVIAMQGLKHDRFWNNQQVSEDVNIQKLAENRQEVFWLKLLQTLKDGSDTRAMDLLKSNKFKSYSFHPEIERALQIVLVYRRWGVLVDPGIGASSPDSYQHQFFKQLDMLVQRSKDSSLRQVEIPPDLDNLLKSNDVFSIIFLAGGWLEASLGLNRLSVIPEKYPDWIAYGFTQALRYNRGNRTALNFAQKQLQTPALSVLTAEIMLADNQVDKAIPSLRALAQGNTDVGFRAAWFLSLVSLKKGDLQGARRIVQEYKSLSHSTAGREILARIALDEGNTPEADRLYREIEKASPEAKTYLARRAYANKDWKTARKYTEELLSAFPDMMEYRENLRRISEEEKHDRP